MSKLPSNKHIGSTLDDLLAEDGTLDELTELAKESIDSALKGGQHSCPVCGTGFVVDVVVRFPHLVLAPDGWPSDPKNFGQCVCRARLTAGKRQIDLAKQTGLSDFTIRAIERGRYEVPARTRKAVLIALAQFGQHYPTYD